MSIVNDYRKNGKVKFSKLSIVSDVELTDLKVLVDKDIADIGIKLDQAKSEAHVNHIYADPKWFNNARAAKKIKGILSQAIQAELKKRKQQNKNKSCVSSDKLIQAMDAVLTPDLKAQVLAQAMKS